MRLLFWIVLFAAGYYFGRKGVLEHALPDATSRKRLNGPAFDKTRWGMSPGEVQQTYPEMEWLDLGDTLRTSGPFGDGLQAKITFTFDEAGLKGVQVEVACDQPTAPDRQFLVRRDLDALTQRLDKKFRRDKETPPSSPNKGTLEWTHKKGTRVRLDYEFVSALREDQRAPTPEDALFALNLTYRPELAPEPKASGFQP